MRFLMRKPVLAVVMAACAALSSHAGSIPNFRGRLQVLSIGVNEYPGGSNISSIGFGVADAEAMGDIFAKAGNTSAFNGVKVTRLLGSGATSKSVVSALRQMANDCQPTDTFVFYFGGMGWPAPSSNGRTEYYFALADSRAAARFGNIENAITAGELSRLLLNIPARRQILILDSLMSGRALTDVYGALNADTTFTLESRARHFALLGVNGAANETKELGHGLLTYAILKGFAGEADANHDGVVTEAEIEGYLMVALPALSRREGGLEEQLESESNLRGLCLWQTKDSKGWCNSDYGMTEVASADKQRGLGDGESTLEPSAQGLGQDYALIVAGDTYDNWPSLSNPTFDAETLRKELEQNYGYKSENITFVKDPKKKDVSAALRMLHEMKFGDGDRLLIYVAGHGEYTKLDRMGYLVTRDSQKPDVDPDHDTFVAFGALRDSIDTISSGHILVVLDVCFGGTFDQHLRIAGLQGNVVDQPVSLEKVVETKMKSRSRFYLTSGGVRSVSDGEPGRHSPFARAFLNTLRQYGGEQHLIDMGMLSGYLYRLEPQPRIGIFGIREADGNPDFVFVPRNNPEKVSDPSLN